ncbi:2-succinyl-6-hydroxy-2,4-cyclohexadiene-1-carboxylate synthase [Natrialba chahannaoensis JCM 10990]|uniref:2-succinyl-5-enolpyruvyl-6-hydroxy-3-cyclohexene-1-carboxylate synthase n=1 Tax=Natrialba chahannaoensis JCM 10990 TaxID=1227492 RepID=M0AKM8_9EURY|nr:2-succinyl-5-enolpyruvyl-6-hydroxy-3-cyclohexene-1-carboxylic-acid synthase [Natrialba chahannaoensis]ELY99079.1 2-succinyl-6-hydroxy-2,4-cyclohexadiene-1-carboxylate synthase [Natrialba chahannaoensis JCM 10990]
MTTHPNRATLWGRILVDELAAGGLEAVCLAPGSRSTPLTIAFAEHPGIEVFSHLDERSAAFFALGRARRTGEPTALVCTSGTAAANFHPAVIEADQARVPMLVLTADRPPELRDSGANQTVDQLDLYGDAVRWHAELPVPEASERTVRSLRTSAARALLETTVSEPGPVHLNCPFRKPLEPIETDGLESVPDAFSETLAGRGRDGAFVETRELERGTVNATDVDSLRAVLESAARPLIVAGPADPVTLSLSQLDPADVVAVADAVGAPVLADPLSNLRFGPHVAPDGSASDTQPIYGGYDGYIDELPAPDAVLRFGASPTSKRLRHFLRDADTRQFLLDPAGAWREATFTTTDLVAAEPGAVFGTLADELVDTSTRTSTSTTSTAASESGWRTRFAEAEHIHWTHRDDACTDEALESTPFEGAILTSVFEAAPDPATVFVSNSMPIRDGDRFGRPREADLTVLANRGASGIDGITSSALGAGSATDEPLVLVTGDLAFYHDSNGLLALERCGVDATIVLLDNDGGGIFHKLPVEEFDPPFTSQFKTPHGLEFDALAELYELEFERVTTTDFEDAYRQSLASEGTQVLSVEFDSAASHRRREELDAAVRAAVGADDD